MDITFQTEEGIFNYRVCGIILHEGKVLAMHDERSPYFYLPGGRVRLHESASQALLRELWEELGIKADILRPLWLNQGFFTEDVSRQRYHEICLYFLVKAEEELLSRGESFTRREKTQLHRFEWLDFNRLKTEYFYPAFLKEKIFELPETFTLLENFD